MRSSLFLLILLLSLAACKQAEHPPIASEPPPAENSAPPASGNLIMDSGWELVNANCSSCHSLSLVTQNRMTRSNWISTIRWMQKKQGLWELGHNEAVIVDYLAKNYGVADVPWRRKPLKLGRAD
jgi:hypothetical protein